jgi:ParB family chromosome partitioning protein
LPQELLEALRQGKVEYTKAQAIARVKDAAQRVALLEKVIQKDLPLSQIREHVKALTFETDKEAPKAKLDDLYRRVTKAKLWEDPKKWKQAQVLLAKLAALVEEE